MRQNRKLFVWIVIAFAAAVLAACGGSDVPTRPVSGGGAPQPADATATVEALAGVAPLDTPTPPTPGGDNDSGDLPANAPENVTGFELIATGLGEAIYSGYACTIAEVGCACDQPVIQQASFTFETPLTIKYVFGGPGYSAQWTLDRVGPNQWSHTIGMFSEEGQREGAFFVLLTFADDGYIVTQGADLDEGGMIACPDVYFRRLRDD